MASSDKHADRQVFLFQMHCVQLIVDDRLEKAIVAALHPVSPEIDPKMAFWHVYKKVADEHDTEFREKHKGDLDTSLVFVSGIGFIFRHTQLIRTP